MITEKEGNALIAKFMGIRVLDKRPRHNIGAPEADLTYYLSDKMKYHRSWDWLMPVCDKIRSMHLYVSLDGDSAAITSRGVEDDKYPWLDKFQDIYITGEGTPIELAWIAVVQFITWYNKNKS